jgi:hypothetical protein
VPDATICLTVPGTSGERLELGTSLLFTRNSNPGKSVENSTWAGGVWMSLRPDARLAHPAGRYREVSPLTVGRIGSVDG